MTYYLLSGGSNPSLKFLCFVRECHEIFFRKCALSVHPYLYEVFVGFECGGFVADRECHNMVNNF